MTQDKPRHAPLAMVLALLAIAWLLLAAWGAAQYRQATHRGPVLYAPMSVAVDPSDGTVYCASGAGRVHKYGPRGEGRGAFVIETGGERARLAYAGDGTAGEAGAGVIDLAVEGSPRVIRFDAGGRNVGERDDPEAFARFAAAESARSLEPGPIVVLEEGSIFERSPAGVRILVSALPFPLSYFAAAPWTLVLSLFLSTLLLMASFVWPFLARPSEDGVR